MPREFGQTFGSQTHSVRRTSESPLPNLGFRLGLRIGLGLAAKRQGSVRDKMLAKHTTNSCHDMTLRWGVCFET